MRTLQVLHANRLAVLLGSVLLCLVGFVAGCDDTSTTPAKLDPTANKSREEAESAARKAAYGTTGAPTGKAVKGTPKK